MRDTKIIKRWKYDLIRTEIMDVLAERGEEGVAFPELLQTVTDALSEVDRMQIGNVKWHIESVTLELETAGELERFPETETPLPKNVRRAE